MGRAATDGDYDRFKGRVQALDISFGQLDVRCETLRGETLAFGWTRPLTVDGEEQPLSGYDHYDGPFCTAPLPAQQMDIRYGEYVLRLHFE
jgi:hypothetical protein